MAAWYTNNSRLASNPAKKANIMNDSNPVRDEDKTREQLIREIEELRAIIKDQEAKLDLVATHDPLTGLPNRVLLNDRVSQAMLHAQRTKQPFVLMSLDMDRFQSINSSLGHSAGDMLLKTAALRLYMLLRKEDTIARLGSDEFVLLLPRIGNRDNAFIIARKILAAFQKPFALEDREVRAMLSIGISMFPDDGDSAEELLRRADLALHQAKQMGRNGYECYSPALEFES